MQFNIEDFKSNINNYSNEELCEMIVCYRYLNFNREAYLIAMQELSNRRNKGSIFSFEDYIDYLFQELPALDFSIPDIRKFI